MKKFLLRSLLGITLFAVTVVASFFCIPSAAKWMISVTASHFLGHRFEISAYTCSFSGLHLNGEFDDNSTLSLEALNLLYRDRSVTVLMHGNARLFSTMAGNQLPNLPFTASMHYRRTGVVLNASLLDGSLHGDLNLTDMRYRYRYEDLSVETFLTEQNLPSYANGGMSGTGSGQLSEHARHVFALKLNNINLKKALIDRVDLKSLKAPIPLKLDAQLAFSNQSLLTIEASGVSPLLEVNISHASYDTDNGIFELNTSLYNTGLDDLPLKNTLLHGHGTFLSSHLNAEATADIDTFRMHMPNLTLNPDGMVTLQYHLQSITPKPLNLMGDNAIFGNLERTPTTLHATAKTRQMTEPIALEMSKNDLDVISNNIPLGVLTSIANLENMPTGHFDLTTNIDLNSSPIKVAMHVNSEDLRLPTAIGADLNQSDPLSIDVQLHNEGMNYIANLAGSAHMVQNLKMHARYQAKPRRIGLEGETGPITLPGYTTPKAVLRASIDLNSSTLLQGAIETPNESLRVPAFHFTPPVKADIHFTLAHLERFSLSPQESIEGTATVQNEKNTTSILLRTDGWGRFRARIEPGHYAVQGDSISVRRFSKLLGQPALLDGTLNLSADLNRSQMFLALASSSLVPLADLNHTLSSFPLQAVLQLTGDTSHKSGTLTVKTAHERFNLDIRDLNMEAQSIDAAYKLHFDQTAHSILYALRELPAQKIMLSGAINAAPAKQSITLDRTPLLLGENLHRKIEENASSPLPVTLEANLSRQVDTLILSAMVENPTLTIAPLHFSYNMHNDLLDFHTTLITDKWLGDTHIDFKGYVDRNGSVDRAEARILAPHKSLTLSALRLDRPHGDYSGRFALKLESTHAQKGVNSPAVVTGNFKTKPLPQMRLNTYSLDGNLTALMNEDRLYIHARDLNLSQIADFTGSASFLQSGNIDADAIVDAKALLEGNLTLLDGGVDIKARDVYLKGIGLDAYLSTLRDTQDLSVFKGSLSDMPLVRNVKDIPKELKEKESLPSTRITKARFALALREGMAVCDDCALNTSRHRLAFAGDIDLPHQRFNHFYVALLNPKGCAYFTQRIKGALDDPEVDILESGVKVVGGAVISLASNVTDAANLTTSLIQNIFDRTGDALSYVPLAGKSADAALNTVGQTLHQATSSVSECVPFYIGSIPPPNRTQK